MHPCLPRQQKTAPTIISLPLWLGTVAVNGWASCRQAPSGVPWAPPDFCFSYAVAEAPVPRAQVAVCGQSKCAAWSPRTPAESGPPWLRKPAVLVVVTVGTVAQGLIARETEESRPVPGWPCWRPGNSQWFVVFVGHVPGGCQTRDRHWGGPDSASRNGASDKSW